ncbi:MAG TPA: cyclic-di-AMP receptor [Anaerolineaceae bacterium]|nr:cyclic-di-AMP receptor [Anaerolineaceae bacterium]
MKLIIAVLRDVDHEPVSNALTADGFRVTMVASTGGFFRRGSSTLLIGLENDQVEKAIDLIRRNCTPADAPAQKRATIFVLPVENLVQL